MIHSQRLSPKYVPSSCQKLIVPEGSSSTSRCRQSGSMDRSCMHELMKTLSGSASPTQSKLSGAHSQQSWPVYEPASVPQIPCTDTPWKQSSPLTRKSCLYPSGSAVPEDALQTLGQLPLDTSIVHVTPRSLDSHPCKQVHEKLPAVFEQVASAWQSSDLRMHSSISVHAKPLPVYPTLHVHTNEPSLFKQLAFAPQLLVPSAHSSSSVHDTPSPL
mmetsp:Transcript_22699/g.53804  ORF Transcript_22699/g.53804 Transcript_22699/m.53804 type:complete len:216 (+) Transcript_22699:5339-5986(+)